LEFRIDLFSFFLRLSFLLKFGEMCITFEVKTNTDELIYTNPHPNLLMFGLHNKVWQQVCLFAQKGSL